MNVDKARVEMMEALNALKKEKGCIDLRDLSGLVYLRIAERNGLTSRMILDLAEEVCESLKKAPVACYQFEGMIKDEPDQFVLATSF